MAVTEEGTLWYLKGARPQQLQKARQYGMIGVDKTWVTC